MYSTTIATTKTFRLKPGTHPNFTKQLWDYCDLNRRTASLARKVLKITERKYTLDRMYTKLNAIENKLWTLRNDNMVWQDNTGLAEQAIEMMLDNYIKAQEEFGWNISISDRPRNLYHRSNNGSSIKHLTIEMFVMSNMMKVLYEDGKHLANVETPSVALKFVIPFHKLLNGLSTLLVDENANVKYGFAPNARIVYNPNKISHPFISAHDNGLWVYCCLGELGNVILRSLFLFDYKNAQFWIDKWGSTYTINRTNPLNNINTLYHGSPKYLEKLTAVVSPLNSSNCRYPNIYRNFDDIPEVSYCETSDCQLASACKFYNENIDVTLNVLDQAALYEIADNYWEIYHEHDEMPDDIEDYINILFKASLRRNNVKSLGFYNILYDIKHIDDSMNNLLEEISNMYIQYYFNRAGNWKTSWDSMRDLTFPILALYSILGTNKVPYIREDTKEEQQRINGLYNSLYQEANYIMKDLEMEEVLNPLTHALPYKIKAKVNTSRNEPISGAWAEYLHNNNLISVGGQNE